MQMSGQLHAPIALLIEWELVGLQNRSRRFGEEKNFLPLLGVLRGSSSL